MVVTVILNSRDTCLSDCSPRFTLNSAPHCLLDQFVLLLLSSAPAPTGLSFAATTEVLSPIHTHPTATMSLRCFALRTPDISLATKSRPFFAIKPTS